MTKSELGLFCMQLSLLLKAGIPIDEAVRTLEEDAEEKTVKEQLKQITNQLEQFVSFADALRTENSFPNYMVEMVQIGEYSGRLDEVLEGLGTYYEREENIKQTVKSVLVYPLILASLMLGVMIVLITKVLPIFNMVLQSLGGRLNRVATAFMHLGTLINRYALGIMIVLVMILLGVFIGMRVEKGRQLLTSLIGKGHLSEKISTVRLANAMAMMLSSGLTQEEAMKRSEALVTHVKVKDKLKHCIEEIEDGNSFIATISQNGLFSGRVISLLKVGIKTGHLETVMERVAKDYAEEVEYSLNKCLQTIEPVFIGILAVLMGSIIISAMLPLIGIMSSLG